MYVALASVASASDSLSTKSYEYFHLKVTQAKPKSLEVYTKAWLKKAKQEGNLAETMHVYKLLMHQGPVNERFIYADSLLIVARKTNDPKAIGAAYLTLGAAYNHNKDFQKALDYYLLADQNISQTDDEYLTYKIKYAIGNIKYYLGYYSEAISLLNQCVLYFEIENETAYLKSLHALSLCYIANQNYSLANQTNKIGISESRATNNVEMLAYFTHAEGIVLFHQQQYQSSLRELNRSLPFMIKKDDWAGITVAYFYLAKNYLQLHDEKKGIKYLRKVDYSVRKHNYIRPDLRETYEILLQYYENKANVDSVYYYGKQLMYLDKKIASEYKYLIGKVFKEYDTKEFTEAQKRTELKRIRQNKMSVLLISGLILIILVMIIRHNKIRKRYRKKYELIMSEKFHEVSNSKIETPKNNAINSAIVTTSLQRLAKFEKDHLYIKKDMILIKVAEYLDVNQKYASQIIYQHRGKRFPEYISDLKIQYAVNLLRNDPRAKNYKNDSLAEAVGFGSTQNFTKAFKLRLGVSPTFFIEQLKKDAK